MPAILAPRDYERWLAPADPMRLPIDLLPPFDTEQLKAWKISADVGNITAFLDGPLTSPMSWYKKYSVMRGFFRYWKARK